MLVGVASLAAPAEQAVACPPGPVYSSSAGQKKVALGLQCSFASTAAGNLLTKDEQSRKAARVGVETARRVCGSTGSSDSTQMDRLMPVRGCPLRCGYTEPGVARRAVLARWKLHR